MSTENESMSIRSLVVAVGLIAVVAACIVLLMLGFEMRLGPLSFVAPVLLCCVSAEPLSRYRAQLDVPYFKELGAEEPDGAEQESGAEPVGALARALAAQLEAGEQSRAALEASDAVLAELRRFLSAPTSERMPGYAQCVSVFAEMTALQQQQRQKFEGEVDTIEEERWRFEVARLQWRFVDAAWAARCALDAIPQARDAHGADVEAALEIVEDKLYRHLGESDLAASRHAYASSSLYDEDWSRRLDALRAQRSEHG